jgi:hypothetical protein
LASLVRAPPILALKEIDMRVLIAAALTMISGGVIASELEDAHRQAIQGRNAYWNCLAREYSRESNQNMSEDDFKHELASVCPSERQIFRVMLLDYLRMEYPNVDAGAHLTTANRAVEAAQKDVLTAFAKHKESSK